MVIAFTLLETEHRVSVLAYQTRVDDLLSNFWTRSHFPDCAGVHPQKVRAESSSNGSEVAECQFQSAQKSELSSHQMAPAGVIAQLAESSHSSSWTAAAYEPYPPPEERAFFSIRKLVFPFRAFTVSTLEQRTTPAPLLSA